MTVILIKKYWKRTAIMVIVAPLLVLYAGCGNGSRKEADTRGEDVAYSADFSEEAYAWADSVVAGLSLREKASQLVMPAMYASFTAEDKKLLAYYVDSLHVGGVILLKGDSGSAKEVSDYFYSHGKTVPFVAIDAEWGLGMRLDDAPVFPRNGNIRDDAEEDLMYEYGSEVARECRMTGINMVLGPVLDVRGENDRKSVMGMRSFGPDAVRVSRLGVAYSRGLEDGNVISVAKHFPGHGSADADSHKRLAVLTRNKEDLEKTDLLPFREYIASGLSGVMVGHLSVMALDSIKRPAAFSPVIIDGWLRERLGFTGLVLTDALNMKGSVGCNASDAILSGADIVTAPVDTEGAINDIVRRVETGELSELALREHCRRILFYKYIVALSGHEAGFPIYGSGSEGISRQLKKTE